MRLVSEKLREACVSGRGAWSTVLTAAEKRTQMRSRESPLDLQRRGGW